MKVVITKINEILFSGEATSLRIPGIEGEMTILPHHSPLVTLLRAGTVAVKSEGNEQSFPVLAGFVEVGENAVTVLV